MNRHLLSLGAMIIGLTASAQARAESTIEVDPQNLRPITSTATPHYAVNKPGSSAEELVTPVRRRGYYGRSYYGGYSRPYSSYYGGGWGYPSRSYSYYRPHYNYGYSSYSSYPYHSYGYNSYPRYTTGYRYGYNPGVSLYLGW